MSIANPTNQIEEQKAPDIVQEDDDQKVQLKPGSHNEQHNPQQTNLNIIYAILLTIIVVLIAILFRSSLENLFRTHPVTNIALHCPAEIHYAQIPLNHYEINASHPHHINKSISYHWKLVKISSKGIKPDIYDKKTSVLKFERLQSEGQYDFVLELEAQISDNQRKSKECKVTVLLITIPRFSIDLGTTFSCISYRDPSKEIVLVPLGKESGDPEKLQYCMPTAIYFPKTQGKVIQFGYDALYHLPTDPKNVIFDVKRIVGRHRNESEVQQFIKTHEFKLSDDEYPKIIIPNWNNMEIIPEQALAAILVYLVHEASKQFETPYSPNVVVSIPAFFHNGPRKGVRSACHIAGLNPQKLVVEPSAAALAFMSEATSPDINGVPFLTFDFGGGTLDCSIVRCQGIDCRVIAVSGDPALGGIDFDNIIKNMIINKLKGIDISQNDRANITKQAEIFKKRLTIHSEYCENISINDIDHKVCISRNEFEENSDTKKLVERAINTAQSAIDKYLETQGHIKKIILIGGSSKIPMIQKALKTHFFDNVIKNMIINKLKGIHISQNEHEKQAEIFKKRLTINSEHCENISINGIDHQVCISQSDLLEIVHPKGDKQYMVVSGGAIIADKLECYNMKTNCPIIGVADVVPLSLGFATCVGNPAKAQKVDLVYVLDATISMAGWIAQVKQDIHKLITDMKSEFPDYSFRIAGVAYRDWNDKNPPHIEYINFTDNVDKFRDWLATLRAAGGGQMAEDVLGGLNKASELSWDDQSAVKLIIHICDAPPHHKMYHKMYVSDEYPSGYFKDPPNYHQVVLDKFRKKGITLMITKLTNAMEVMIDVFKSYASTIDVTIYDEDFRNANSKKLLQTSEHILTEEIDKIKLATTSTTYSEDSAKYTGKYECDVMDIVIRKNTPYPIKRTKKYCTHNPMSTKANFQLYEGDERSVINNYFLSNITITNVPEGSCETAMIDVIFDIDRDGIATIKATINTTVEHDASKMKASCDSGSCIMTLGVLSKDGALSDDDIIAYRKMMVNWFSSNAIQTVLNE